MLRSLVWFSLEKKISKCLVVDLHKAGGEGVLKIPTQEHSINKQITMRAKAITLSGCPEKINHNIFNLFWTTDKILCSPHLPPLLLECFGRLKDLLDSTWDDPPRILQIAPFHSKGLPAASLAISEAANVVPIQSRLHQKGNLFENLTL